MIAIQLVRCNGRLVGLRASDRWNLAMLGINSVEVSKNQGALKRLRRTHKQEFTFSVVRGSISFEDGRVWDWDGAMTQAAGLHFELTWFDALWQGFDVAREAA
jgi:hypothetical protein